MTSPDIFPTKRLSVRLSGPLAAHVERQISNHLYESDSEYIRDLVRKDMLGNDEYDVREGIIEGYANIAEGRFSNKSNDQIFAEAMQEAKDEGYKL